jgi:hypothetical protein
LGVILEIREVDESGLQSCNHEKIGRGKPCGSLTEFENVDGIKRLGITQGLGDNFHLCIIWFLLPVLCSCFASTSSLMPVVAFECLMIDSSGNIDGDSSWCAQQVQVARRRTRMVTFVVRLLLDSIRLVLATEIVFADRECLSRTRKGSQETREPLVRVPDALMVAVQILTWM